jgi:hypothetical protein
LGALFTSSAISSLTGPPLIGLLIDWTGNLMWPAIFAAASGVLAFMVLIPLGRSDDRAGTIDTIALEVKPGESRSASERF